MRRKLDFYSTPEWATLQLLDHLPAKLGVVLEPCAGAGDIAKVIALERRGEVYCNDIDEETLWPTHWDATRQETWQGFADWVITNPPFNVAAEILPIAFNRSRIGMAMLLRLSYLEPVEDRGAWLTQHPPTKLIVLPRISFTNDGKTDSVTCAWMIWDKEASSQQIIVAENPRFTQAAASLRAFPNDTQQEFFAGLNRWQQ